jgi:hypothetical protein
MILGARRPPRQSENFAICVFESEQEMSFFLRSLRPPKKKFIHFGFASKKTIAISFIPGLDATWYLQDGGDDRFV